MKNLFGIVCLLALFACSLGASATPDITDTSPIVCVADFSPDLSVEAVNIETPTFGEFYTFTCNPSDVSASIDLAVPDNPDIESPDLNCITSANPDPTLGESAECSTDIETIIAETPTPTLAAPNPSNKGKGKAKRKNNRKNNKSLFPGTKPKPTKCAAYN